MTAPRIAQNASPTSTPPPSTPSANQRPSRPASETQERHRAARDRRVAPQPRQQRSTAIARDGSISTMSHERPTARRCRDLPPPAPRLQGSSGSVRQLHDAIDVQDAGRQPDEEAEKGEPRLGPQPPSSRYPPPKPITIANTNDKPTVLSWPMSWIFSREIGATEAVYRARLRLARLLGCTAARLVWCVGTDAHPHAALSTHAAPRT